MYVIGTAGHVDHGKSTLIEALTGTHPDRLREEREREMTIVLGFAWMTLPNGEEVGVVDVPGHRDFIENMLSGIGAIDAALFVVAADEGVMPQTREHLAILDLLQIQGGVVVLTKTDLIDDPEWLDLIETDLQDTLTGTVLESAPIVRVSARSREGIPELLDILSDLLSDRPPRPDLGRPRLSVDRVFTMSGFGTIVTGTLTDGYFEVGQEVAILPQRLRGRIRGLQTHKRKEQSAVPGSRTAVNITGVNVNQIQRGNVVAYPGHYKPSRRLDVYFRMLRDVSQPLRHNMEVKLFVGASEVIARLRLLGIEALDPGEEGFLQLELSAPAVVIRGDRFILRRPSPGETLGGGIILDPQPKGRYKRFDSDILKRLQALEAGTPEDVLLQAVLTMGIASRKEVLELTSLEPESAQDALDTLMKGGQILALDLSSEAIQPDTLMTSQSYWQQLTNQARKVVAEYQKAYPLRLGIPREELKSRLRVSAVVFNLALANWLAGEVLAETNVRQNVPGTSVVPVIHLPNRQIAISSQQKQQIDSLINRFANNSVSPPTIKECVADVGEDLYNAMIDLGYLIPLNSEVVYRREDYEEQVQKIRSSLEELGSITVAQVRDQFQTSRRYVLALLEHLDSIGLTVRVGDVRKLKQRSG